MIVEIDNSNLPVTKITVRHSGTRMRVEFILHSPFIGELPENRMNITISDVCELSVIKGVIETLHERIYSDEWREVHHEPGRTKARRTCGTETEVFNR